MKNRKVKKTDRQGRNPALLTPKELAFVAAWQGDQTAAARQAGYKNPKQAGHKLMTTARVKKAVEAKQKAVVQESGTQLGKTLSKTDVLSRALTLADMNAIFTKGNIMGQVNALRLIADIQGLIIKKNLELPSEFYNRTETEQEFFAQHGYWPDNLDAGQSGPAGAQTPSQNPR